MVLGVPVLKHFRVVCKQQRPQPDSTTGQAGQKSVVFTFPVRILFSSPVQMYRKSYCTTHGVGVGGSGSVDKMLKDFVKVFM